jgi:hypothetical protein
MWRFLGAALALILAFSAQAVSADDLTGSTRFLCSAVQATECLEGGECGIDLPWNLNMPAFIEIDLEAKMLSTTEASGLNRKSPIEHLSRADGIIFLQGYELGKGFTFVISEQTGQVTVAIATESSGVIVFGSCTPLTSAAASGRK